MSRRILIFAVGLMGLAIHASAQEAATFTMQVSSDSVLLGNRLAVRFTLKNAEGKDFTPPAFEGFDVNGPQVSSSMSIVGSQVSRQLSYTYYIEPLEAGNFYIEPASIVADESVLETVPFEVIALPNPDGIAIEPKLDDDAFQFDFDQSGLLPPLDLKPEKKKKKKRKTYKM